MTKYVTISGRPKVWVVHKKAREIYEGTVYGVEPENDIYYVCLNHRLLNEMMDLPDEYLFFDKDEAEKRLFKLNLAEERGPYEFEWIEDEDLCCRP